MSKNPGHVKPTDLRDKPYQDNEDLNVKDLEKQNESRSEGLPTKEPRNVRQAGGGVKGKHLGGSHTGRDESRPGQDLEKRKPYGRR